MQHPGGAVKTRTCGDYLLTSLLIVCAAGGAHATDRGTLEFGIAVGATRFGEFLPGEPFGYDYSVGQVRAGLFMERRFSLETSVRLELVEESFVGPRPSGEKESFANANLGLDLSFLYHFKLADGGSSIFLGPIGSVDQPKIRGTANEAQFALGVLLGFKTLSWSVNPRLDLFWQRRFEINVADGFMVYGARLGFSLFFKSSSPWDK